MIKALVLKIWVTSKIFFLKLSGPLEHATPIPGTHNHYSSAFAIFKAQIQLAPSLLLLGNRSSLC
jgi:hypothetical protein